MSSEGQEEREGFFFVAFWGVKTIPGGGVRGIICVGGLLL